MVGTGCEQHLTEIVIGGRRVAYRACGDASRQAVLLLHGLPMSSYLWRNVLPRLADALPGWRIVAPDLPGYGRSEPARRAGPIAAAECCAALHARLSLERVVVVGHDFGGLAALYVALQPATRGREHATCVAGLVLSDTTFLPTIRLVAGLLPAMVPGLSDVALAWLGRGGRRARALRRQRYLHGLRELLMPGTCLTARDQVVYAERFAARAGWRQLQRDLRGLARDTPQLVLATTRLPRLPPVALVWGAHDPIFPLATARRIRRALPGTVSLQVIPGAGHFVPEDDPAAVANAIAVFVKQLHY